MVEEYVGQIFPNDLYNGFGSGGKLNFRTL